MKKKYGRQIAALLMGVLLTGALAACGGGNAGGGASSAASADASQSETASGGAMTMDELLNASWDQIRAQAVEEGEVTFAVWADEAEWNQLADRFAEATGVKANVLVGEKTTVMDKALTELSGDASIDIMMLSGETVNGLMNADALTPGILPIMENKDKLVPGLSARKEGVSNEKGYWVPISTSPAGFLYNANELSEADVPQTFEELEAFIDNNPGKYGFCIPENGGTGQGTMEMIIAALTGGLDQYLLVEGNVCDPALLETWDVVWDWFNERKDKIAFTTSNADGISRLNSGEIWMVTAWNSGVKDAVDQGNLSINHGFYVPDQGICYSGEVLSILRNSTHPAAALTFINWMTTEEGQLAQAELVKALPSRVDVETDISLLSEEERAKNTDWMSACYKTQYIQDFTTHVLQ